MTIKTSLSSSNKPASMYAIQPTCRSHLNVWDYKRFHEELIAYNKQSGRGNVNRPEPEGWGWEIREREPEDGSLQKVYVIKLGLA